MAKDIGRVTGSRADAPSPSASTKGFDLARLEELKAGEGFVAAALTAAYNAGQLHYAHYSPAYDVTACRMLALDHAIASEVRRAEGIAQTPSPNQEGSNG